MKITQITTEQQIVEKPSSGLGNMAKGLAGKAASAIGMSGTGGRLSGGAEVGKKANELYANLARWQGINGKNDKNMTAADVQAWAKQNKVNVSKVKMPDGVLTKNILMDILKKVAASELTGGNVAATPTPAAQQGGSSASAAGGSAEPQGVLAKMQAATGKKSAATPGSSNTKQSNVTQLKNKDGIPPNIQQMLDGLTPTEKKALAGVI